MTLSGCEHCGFISDEHEPPLSGPCPECGRELEPMKLAAVGELLRERITAQRFRWRAAVSGDETAVSTADQLAGRSG